MRRKTIRAWSAVHTWTSMICTGFLLMLCVTGLPLIFHDEIEAAATSDSWAPANPGGEHLALDEILNASLANAPGEVPLYMSFDTDRPVVNVTTGPVPDAGAATMRFSSFDATSGEVVPPSSGPAGGIAAALDWLLRLHTDMFLGLPGMLFLGAMGAFFVLAVVSGVVVYAPVMGGRSFGTVRHARRRRIRWLDVHNLLGIVTVAWATVVGLTGVVNTLEKPILDAWRERALADLIEPYEGREVPTDLASIGDAVARAEAAAPAMTLQFVAFPGTDYSTDHHYAVFLHGDTPLTERIITPVLLDAETGALDGLRRMPLFAQALAVSRPLHFGDYGGLPLKIIWAILDLFTIAVLVTGLYLFAVRKSGRAAKAGRLVSGAP